jgi:hypothetical protein
MKLGLNFNGIFLTDVFIRARRHKQENIFQRRLRGIVRCQAAIRKGEAGIGVAKGTRGSEQQ